MGQCRGGHCLGMGVKVGEAKKPPFASAETLFSEGSPPKGSPRKNKARLGVEGKKPPFASSETLFSPGHTSLAELQNAISVDKFKKLGEDAKLAELLKIVPLLGPFSSAFSSIESQLLEVEERVSALERARGFTNGEDSHSLNSEPSERIPDPHIINKSRLLNKRLTINVGGVRHEVLWRLLSLVPLSRLGLLSRARTHQEIIAICSDYSIVENVFFFDRHPRSFNTILNFYRTGKLHLADEMCVLAFGEDLHYWGLSADHLDSCCYDKFIGKRELVIEQMEGNSRKVKKEEEDDFGDGKFAKYQKMIWDLMEKSETSTAAQVVSVISMSFVAVSIVGMVISTMPQLKSVDAQGNLVENPRLALIETVCIAWFTLEYFLRMAGSPDKWEFVKNGLNVVDVISILPFYIDLFFLQPPDVSEADPNAPTEAPDSTQSSLQAGLQVFRIFKLARVLKLARHSPGLQAIAYTLQHSYKELLLLIFLILVSGIIFASLAYFIEIEEDSGFTSIPAALYWVVITMTTVGYGDIYPTSPLGKLVGSLCAVAGVLVLSLPIPIIAQNFEAFHMETNRENRADAARQALDKAREEEYNKRVGLCGPPTVGLERSTETFCPSEGARTR